MNETRKFTNDEHVLRRNLARRLLLVELKGRWVRPGRFPHLSVHMATRRKLLKIERLRVFHFGSEIAFFRQAKGLAEIGNTLGHISHADLTTRNAQRADKEHLSRVRVKLGIAACT
jgi:hypothetical protein